jgi:pimeloyl-ACP methyl ester carboxylesterase
MVKQIKLSLLVSGVVMALITGCGYDNEDKNIVGDNLVITKNTFVPVAKFSKEAIQAGFTATHVPFPAQLGINSYKINYMTTDDNGNAVEASGLVTVPQLSKEFLVGFKALKKRDFSLSIVSDQHGTIFTDAEAPTKEISATKPNTLSTLFSAAALYMTVQPDYIGHGDSKGEHPFILEKSLANSTVDMIEAAIAFANKAGLPINGQVFLSGYSEGGYATLAAAKEIQQHHPDIELKAVAPMAGPYDLESIGLGAISAPMMAFPPYLAYVVHSYDKSYKDVSAKDIIVDKYQPILNTIFDGEHNSSVAYISLPNVLTGGQDGQTPDKLFKSTFMSSYQNDKTQPLRKHFAENSPIDWKPTVSMKLVHCTNDNIIPYEMSQLAYKSFKAKGSTSVELVPIDTVTADKTKHETVHGNCARAAYGVVIPWFNDIREGKK